MKFFRVRNWERFQHYHSGRGQPPWLKLYTELQDKPEWMNLPDLTKAHLVGIWMLVPKLKNKIPLEPQFLATKIAADSIESVVRSLELLMDPARGFLEELGPLAAAPKVPTQLPLPGGVASNLLASPTTPQESPERRDQSPPPPPRAGGGRDIQAGAARLLQRLTDGGGVTSDARRWLRDTRNRLRGGTTEAAIAAEIDAENAERATAEAQAWEHQRWLDEIAENGSRDAADRLWEDALVVLERSTNRHTFATWFRPLTPRGLHSTPKGPSLLLEAPNENFASWLKSNHGQLVEDALQGVPVTWIVAPPGVAERGPPARAAPWARAARS
jgi:DnaA-like protein